MTERPNIRRMQMPEKIQYRDIPFDPEKEIKPDHWEIIRKILLNARDAKSAAFIAIAEAMSVLGKKSDIILNPDESKRIVDPLRSESIDIFYYFLPRARLLGLVQDSEFSNMWHRMAADYETAKKNDQWQTALPALFFLKLIDANRAPVLSPDDILKIIKYADTVKEDDSFYFRIMAAARLCGIGQIEVNENRWRAINKEYHEAADAGQIGEALDSARNMAIVAADDFHITENGIQLLRIPQKAPEKNPDQPDTLEI